MDSGKQNADSQKKNKNKGIFMRIVDWIAEGTAKAQNGRGHCSC